MLLCGSGAVRRGLAGSRGASAIGFSGKTKLLKLALMGGYCPIKSALNLSDKILATASLGNYPKKEGF